MLAFEETLVAIAAYRDYAGVWPSLRDLAQMQGVSVHSANEAMRRCLDRGWIERPPGERPGTLACRGWVITEAGRLRIAELVPLVHPLPIGDAR